MEYVAAGHFAETARVNANQMCLLSVEIQAAHVLDYATDALSLGSYNSRATVLLCCWKACATCMRFLLATQRPDRSMECPFCSVELPDCSKLVHADTRGQQTAKILCECVKERQQSVRQ